MLAICERKQLSPLDKIILFSLGSFFGDYWIEKYKQVHSSLRIVRMFARKKTIKLFSSYKVSPALCAGLQRLHWLQSFGFLIP